MKVLTQQLLERFLIDSKGCNGKNEGFIPKSDHAWNRDRQDPSSVIALTKPDFTSYLSSLGNISSTVITELTKYTEDKRANFYPKPIDVCIGKFGTLLIRLNFCEKEQTSSLLSAILHGPVDNIKIVKKALKAKEVIYKDGVAFLCGRSTPMMVVEIESGTLEISESKI